MSQKIKLELKQPQFKCSGRDDITCYYRGKIVEDLEDKFVIEFKYKGETITRDYDKIQGFDDPELRDIKLK